MKIHRSLLPYLNKYLDQKILLLSGPRQCGKTTLSKMISKDHDYINFDNLKDRLILDEQSWNRQKRYIIFDELHKKLKWKSWIKGIFDSEGIPPGLIVTGSAKMALLKKAGDSMVGRFFFFHLFPLTLKELTSQKKSNIKKGGEAMMDRLLSYSGFPEPYLKSDPIFYNLWEKNYIDSILRQDLLDMESPRNISHIELLTELLKEAVGTPVSHSRLSERLNGCSSKTIKTWLEWLERLYIIFKVTPYSRTISRSLKKRPKYYFYNWVLMKNNKGALFENFVACSLLAENKLREDTLGEKRGLYYLRNKNKQEIDFMITKDQKPVALIESKWADDSLSPHFKTFSSFFPQVPRIQLVKELRREKTFPKAKVDIRKASNWLTDLPYK